VGIFFWGGIAEELLLPQEGHCSLKSVIWSVFNVPGSVHRNNIIVYNSNKMHMSQSLFYLTTAVHVSGVTITHLQERNTTVTTASGNCYTVIELNLLIKSTDRLD
jgi:hypothetical protein